MKKLFASILAATMVAGMSVSAFAHVPGDCQGLAADDSDFTLSHDVYIDNGDPIHQMKENEEKVSSGDTLYYPILVSGDELDDSLPDKGYFYANKYSEIDDLKVKLNDVYGGKYIDGDAKIVRKSLPGIAKTKAYSATVDGITVAGLNNEKKVNVIYKAAQTKDEALNIKAEGTADGVTITLTSGWAEAVTAAEAIKTAEEKAEKAAVALDAGVVKAKGILATKTTEASEANTKKTEADEAVKTAEGAVKIAENTAKASDDVIAAVATEKGELDAAQTAYDDKNGTDDTVEKGELNTAQQAYDKAVEDAVAEVEAVKHAKEAVKTNKGKLDEAKEAVETAEKAVKTAEKAVKTAENTAKASKEVTDKVAAAVAKAKADNAVAEAHAITGEVTAKAIKDAFKDGIKDDKLTCTVDKAVTVAAKNSSKDDTASVVLKESKIYCVEVNIDDYFGEDETEVEFDLKLRTRKSQYDSDKNDDKTTNPNMAFTLGADADTCLVDNDTKEDSAAKECGIKKVKFNNDGELELTITEDTKSVKLDEAKEKNEGKKIDVENIYLEGDKIDFTFDVKASNQDNLYLEINDEANKKVILANSTADLYFVNFPGKPEFDFTGTAEFTVDDGDKDWFFYEIEDGNVVNTNAKYDADDECFVLRTRTLGSYVISDKELDTTAKATDDKTATADKTTTAPTDKTTTPVTGKIVPSVGSR